MGAYGNAEGVSRGYKGMPEVVQTLDEATNTLVTPSGLNLTDPDDSRAYADQVWQAGVLLNVAIDEPQHLTSEGVKSIEPCDVFPVAQRALEEVLLQLPLVNDPVGSLIWSAERLAQELAQAVQLAQVDGLRLAEWLLGVLESPYAEQVYIDPVQYAQALGPEGLKELRGRAQGEFVGRRLAVLSGSVEEVFRTHTDGYEQLISGLSEIGRFDLAYTYSEEAMRILPAEETFNIAGGWAAITDVHFPHRSPYVNERVFDAFPRLSAAKGLFAAVGDSAVEHIEARLRDRPWDLSMFQYQCLRDPQRAWATASDAGLQRNVAELLLPHLPVETIPVLMQRIEEKLETEDAFGRDQAYGLLGKVQKAADPASFEDLLGRLQRKFADCPEIRNQLADAAQP